MATLSTVLKLISMQEDGWFGIALDKKYRDIEDEVLAVATFAETNNKIFFNVTNDIGTLDKYNATNIANKLKTLKYMNTETTYSSNTAEYPEAGVIAKEFSVNFLGEATTLTVAHKSFVGVTPEKLSTSQFDAIKSFNCNVYTTFGSNSMYYQGVMAGGKYLDTIHGVAWLRSYIQERVQELLIVSKKVPFTDEGVLKIVQKVDSALRQAVTNGLIAPGYDENGVFLPSGYYINYASVMGIPLMERQTRLYKHLSFKAIGSAAIHGAEISGNFVE